MGIDWTAILVALIGVVSTALSGLLAYVCKKHLRPWLERNNLTRAAEIAVEAAEALLKGCRGEDKLEAALEKMAEYGFRADHQAVRDAIEAAWLNMNIRQVAAGVK